MKLFQKKEKEDKQNIRVMVEATTCTAAYVEDDICTEKKDVDELDIQSGYYEDHRLITCGANMARRMVRRHSGRNLTINPVEENQRFPFWGRIP